MLLNVIQRYLTPLTLVLVVAACGAGRDERFETADNATTPPSWAPMAATQPIRPTQTVAASPRIVTPAKRLQCVPYARELSGIPIRGNAWTWWNKAAGQYERAAMPKVGSVLVFKRTQRNRYGHLAVVTRIVNDREIIVSHSNWLNEGRIHIDTPVRDVSSRNDWSQVRVWYTPGSTWGASVYPANGFIYPPQYHASR